MITLNLIFDETFFLRKKSETYKKEKKKNRCVKMQDWSPCLWVQEDRIKFHKKMKIEVHSFQLAFSKRHLSVSFY